MPKKHFSIHQQYVFFAVTIPLLLLFLSVAVGYYTYQSVKEDRQSHYGEQGDQAVSTLLDTIEYINNFSTFLGRIIAAKGTNDPASVSTVLQSNTKNKALKQNIFTWTMFDFVNPEGYVIAASTIGVLPYTLKITPEKRSWITKAPKTPWKLFLDPPDTGVTSGERIIPTGFGVTTAQGKFLGILSMGLNIKKLTANIANTLSEGTSFLLLTTDYTIVSSSSGAIPPKANTFFAQALFPMQLAHKEDAGRLPESISYQGVTYHYYRYAYPYPYLILIGDNNAVLDREFKQIVMPQVIQTMMLGLFFIVLLYFFRSRIVGPMMKLSNTALALAKGQTDVVIPTMHSVEANALADALAQVQDYQKELLDAHKEVRLMNNSLEERVAERTRSLEEALSAKSEFLNNMSHEVRSPIQGILAFSESLAKDWHRLPEETRYERAVHIGHNSSRLLSLVTNLLDLSQLEKGKMSFNLTARHNLSLLVEEVIKECEPFLREKNLTIHFTPPTIPSTTRLDATRITQAIRNLLINAIRFTEKGTITITITRLTASGKNGVVSPCLELSIKDEGIGIPENEYQTIFDQFNQSSRTKTRAGGTGLGLSIAKQILEAHNGMIWAKNNEDAGSTFTFRLPILGEEDEAADMEAKLENHDMVINTAHILAIDDEKNCLAAIAMYLEMDGHKVTSAIGGIEGLEAISSLEGKIDLILLDLMMPDLYGLDLLKEVKSTSPLKDIPVILQTGSSDYAEIEKGLALGAVDILPKPYDKATLKRLVIKALKQKTYSLTN